MQKQLLTTFLILTLMGCSPESSSSEKENEVSAAAEQNATRYDDDDDDDDDDDHYGDDDDDDHYGDDDDSDGDRDDKIVAIVNGVKIPESRILVYTQGNPVSDINRQEVIDNMITSELFYQDAKKSGFLKGRDEFEQEFVVARQAIVGRSYVADFLEKKPISEEDVDKRYQKLVEELNDQSEYKIAHILVQDEDLANDLLTQIKADANKFASFAQEHSIDPGSASSGGELDWSNPNAFVPEFSNAVSAMEKGDLSATPVKTNFGWHIIRIDDKRNAPQQDIPELNNQLRTQLTQAIQAEIIVDYIDSLKAKSEIEKF